MIDRVLEGADRLVRLHGPALAAGGAAVFLALCAVPLLEESCTFDEGIHLAAAFTSLRLDDHRLVPEHPPLGRRIAALPLLFQDVRLPENGKFWKESWHWGYAFEFLYQSGNDPDRLLLAARAAMLFWPALLILSIYALARDVYGPRGGAVALVLTVFNPALLAHGHLVTTDAASAATMVLAVAAVRRWTGNATLFNTLATGVLLGGALAVKYTAVVLVPLFILIGLAAAWRRRGTSGGSPFMRDAGLARSVSVLLIGVVACIVVWGAYGFRYAASPDPSFRFAPHEELPGIGGRLINLARRAGVLPEAYLYGLDELNQHAVRGHPAFALGEHSLKGWWWYMPVTLLLKTPVGALLLFAWGLRTWFRRSPEQGERDDFAVLSAGTVLLAAVKGTINIGVRHVLPVYPFLALVAGGLAPSDADARPRARALPLLLAATVAGTLAGAPHFLSFFNLPARLLGEKHELLGDSNLDWGQDLRRLKEYAEREGITRLKLGYFGSASPRHLGLDHEVLPGFNWYTRHEPEWRPASGVRPGDTVAVSATLLSGAYLEDPSCYARLLRGRRPDARVGTIYVYRIPP